MKGTFVRSSVLYMTTANPAPTENSHEVDIINKRVYDDDASRNVTGRQRRRETTGIRPGEVTGARLRSHWMNLSLTDLTNLTKMPR